MSNNANQLRDAILAEIESSGMKLERKLRIMQLLDTAFRQHMGVFFLSNAELEKKDILNRSF